MKKFKLVNNITGWITFIISAIVYILTIEPTASFWDCGEFIATAFKLEVGHPPGNSTFMIMGRIATMFAGNNLELVPVMVNIMSALASAFCILFLFWTITHLARKILIKNGEISNGNLIAIMGSGLVGALAYTFSDTFWFSAVEGEVYASSSFFTAIVFWVILKWEDAADEKYANRWIILGAYLMGLSIGVHLLNLLAIPAMVFVYYYKKYPITKKGVLYASIISILILAGIMYGIIPYSVIVASWFELLFVNSFGLPFNSGAITYLILLFGGLFFALYYTYKKQKSLLNTIFLAVTVILIGYSSTLITVIRSLEKTPLNENQPDNVFSLLSYLNRDQYGDRPLFYGQYYNAQIIDQQEGAPIYYQQKVFDPIKNDSVEKYVVIDNKPVYTYDPAFCTVFPRMHSADENHIYAYKVWAGIPDPSINSEKWANARKIETIDRSGQKEMIYKPTFFDNLKFLTLYQIGHMYFRYFMWNFSGRQNDIQGHGNIIHGNWITGITPIDNYLIGDQSKYPESLKSNKAMNKLYLLPFILGVIGIFVQSKHDNGGFWVTLLLFFFTGLAIVLYLNQTPYQPRERDYAYAGSFYAYAIWIGLGVLGLYNFAKKKMPQIASATLVTIVSLLLVPTIMAKENWDDHDRSNRYTARDFAANYLNSCAPNAILFTNGDNDTFPLWYAQEVEGIRRDIRVVNLSLFNTDWYINQMKRKYYDSEPVPISLRYEDYIQGKRDYVPVIDKIKDYVDVNKVVEFVTSNDPEALLNNEVNYFVTKNFSLPIDSATVVNNGTVKLKDAGKIDSIMKWTINKRYIYKSEMMVLDIIATNKWKRPVYFAITVGEDSYLGLDEYFQLDGLAYRLVPIKTVNADNSTGRIDTDILYETMMKKFKWGGINNPKVYLDENNLRMTMNFRNNFSRLAVALLNEGKKKKAIEVLDKCMQVMPKETVPYNVFIIGIAEAYYAANEYTKANKIVQDFAKTTEEDLNYFFSVKSKKAGTITTEKKRAMAILQELSRITKKYNQTKLNKEIENKFMQYYQIYSATEGNK